jgi:protein ImuB
LLDAVADWCDRYTPLVGLDAPDGLMLDITGCAHLFGGESAMGRDLLARLAAEGLHARAAVADTAGCAWGVARYGDASLVPAQQMRAALAPLPAAALRRAPETVEALAEVGLKRIGDLVDLPRAPLAARFGEILVRRLDQALGLEDEPITPRLPLPSYVAEQRFPDPIGLERDVLATIARLAGRLGAAMERRQDGARLLQVALFRTDNKVYRIEVGTGAPLREPSRIARLFADRLATIGEDCDPGFGFDMVRLAALVTERSEPVQAALAHTGHAAPDGDAELWHLIDRLGARFGTRRVTRLVPQDTHIPEFAVAAVPAARGSMAPYLPLPACGERVGVRGPFHDSEHTPVLPSPTCGGGSGRGKCHGTDSLQEPPPQPLRSGHIPVGTLHKARRLCSLSPLAGRGSG